MKRFHYVLTALFYPSATGAEIIFQDFFTSSAGNLTNSVPWMDVQGSGWQSAGAASQLLLDGSGLVFNAAASAGVAAGVALVPIGPHGTMTASALVNLPIHSTEFIIVGFASSNSFLAANGSGPWLEVQGNGNMTPYGGLGLNNAASVANAFTNAGNPEQVPLTYDSFHATATDHQCQPNELGLQPMPR